MGCGCRQSKVQPMLEQKFSGQSKTISLKFYHGFGDCSNFAHQIPLYTKRGYKIQIECTPDKKVLFEAAGAEVVAKATHTHNWDHPPKSGSPLHHDHWSGNKCAYNISRSPMPNIGTYEALWDEYCSIKLNLDKFLTSSVIEMVDNYINDLPKPLILCHFQGNTGPGLKNLPHEEQSKTIKGILDQTNGTIILLDWDNRLFKINNYRVRHLTDDWKSLNVLELYYLMKKSDLMLGVDSGPLHFSRFADIPTIGLWTGHAPSHFVLPRCNLLNLQSVNNNTALYPYRRFAYNIATSPRSSLVGEAISEHAVRMLSSKKYLEHSADDCMLQHFLDRTRSSTSELTQYVDRHKSFDLVFKFLKEIENPLVIETGSIRSLDDFSAGYFGYIMGYFLYHHGGKLHTIELDPKKADFAKSWTKHLDVETHVSHSHEWLKAYKGPKIDLFYSDSADVDTPGYQECCLKEVELALPHLSENGMILIDDTVWSKGKFTGKGTKAVPFLKSQGWGIKFSGYQILLTHQIK